MALFRIPRSETPTTLNLTGSLASQVVPEPSPVLAKRLYLVSPTLYFAGSVVVLIYYSLEGFGLARSVCLDGGLELLFGCS